MLEQSWKVEQDPRIVEFAEFSVASLRAFPLNKHETLSRCLQVPRGRFAS
jgi:hypothetical protein